jgi:GNAT superfamily N-acetyltransferase
VAAAHLVRYGTDARVSDSYRNSAELRWLVFWPGHEEAADALVTACLATMQRWAVDRVYAEGALPAPAVYGVPRCWPHVRAALERAAFAPGDRVEVILIARVEDLPRALPAPVEGLALERLLGTHATRFVASLDGRVAGFFEVQTDLTNGGALSRLAGWGDVWELFVEPDLRRRGIATWMVAEAAGWLRLAGVERVLDSAIAGADETHLAFATRLGWRELTRAERGRTRD